MPGLPPSVPVTVGVLHRAAASRFMASVSRPALPCLGGQVHPGERQEAFWPFILEPSRGNLPKTTNSIPRDMGGVHQVTLLCYLLGTAGLLLKLPPLQHRDVLMGDPDPGNGSAGALWALNHLSREVLE